MAMDGGGTQVSGSMTEVASGAWAGWLQWAGDPFEMGSGPFYARREADGRWVTAFVAEARHMNGGGFMHGGCLMTFADYTLFAVVTEALGGGHAVTASLNGEFIDAARAGDRIEGTGEVIRAGRSLVFARGLITTGGRPLLTWSGIVKRLGDRSAS